MFYSRIILELWLQEEMPMSVCFYQNDTFLKLQNSVLVVVCNWAQPQHPSK